MDAVFLVVLILIGILLVNWFLTITSGVSALEGFVLWLLALGTAYWLTREQALVLRLPTGLLLFVVTSAGAAPISWWSGSKIVVGTVAALCVVVCGYLGDRWSRSLQQRVLPRHATTAVPFYLDQSINLVDDLARWLVAAMFAAFVVIVVPLVFMLALPPETARWVGIAWGFGATAFYLFKFRNPRVRILKLPLGLWVFAAAAVLLQVFRAELAGPIADEGEGSVWVIAYSAYWPVCAATFVEIVLLGTRLAVPSPVDRATLDSRPDTPAGT
jgi:hypothetical protein